MIKSLDKKFELTAELFAATEDTESFDAASHSVDKST
jgi:hypothetical protein